MIYNLLLASLITFGLSTPLVHEVKKADDSIYSFKDYDHLLTRDNDLYNCYQLTYGEDEPFDVLTGLITSGVLPMELQGNIYVLDYSINLIVDFDGFYDYFNTYKSTRYIITEYDISYIDDLGYTQYFISKSTLNMSNVIYVQFEYVNDYPIVYSDEIFNYVSTSCYFNESTLEITYANSHCFISPYTNIPKSVNSFSGLGNYCLYNATYENVLYYPEDFNTSFYEYFSYLSYIKGGALTLYNNNFGYDFNIYDIGDYYSFYFTSKLGDEFPYTDIPILFNDFYTYNSLRFEQLFLTSIHDNLKGTYYLNMDSTDKIGGAPIEPQETTYNYSFYSNGTYFTGIKINYYKAGATGYSVAVSYLSNKSSVVVLDYTVKVVLDEPIGSPSRLDVSYKTNKEEFRRIDLDTRYLEPGLNYLVYRYFSIEPTDIYMPSDSPTYLTDVFNLFALAFGSVSALFNISIFPMITIGSFLLIPLVIMMIIFVVNLFKR